jgi:nucleoside-diphosphate-sugar epimerase
MRRIFVTGASGFIGSHLVKYLSEKGYDVAGLIHSYKHSKWLEAALANCTLFRGDIEDFLTVKTTLNDWNPDCIIHLAAKSIVKRAYKDPVGTCLTNIMGTVNVLEACRNLGIKRVVVQSTDKVYGDTLDATIISPVRPTEPYGTSKCCVDLLAQTYMDTYGLKVVISRMCNAYGYDISDRIIPNTIRKCLQNESPVIFSGDSSKRQYIYVMDGCAALEFLAIEPWVKGIFNIATPDVLSQEEIVLKVLEFFPGIAPKYVDSPKIKQIKSQSMSCTAPAYWKPKVGIKEGIKLTIAEFKKWGF